MIVCPVCEHAQASGGECEVCGLELAAAGGSPAAPFDSAASGRYAQDRPLAAPVEGLEPTAHERVGVHAVPIADLEPTLRPPADELPGEALELDAGRAAPVDVDAPALPDLERIADGVPEDGPTAIPAFTTCRYCRTPAMPGERLCARCGMRLPVVDELRAAGAAEVERRCGCGALVAGDRLCPSCGARPST